MANSTAVTTTSRPSDRTMSASANFARRFRTTSPLPAVPGVTVPSVTGADLLHLIEHSHALVVGVVEVRGDADAAARAVVDDKTTSDQLVMHALGVAGINRDVTAATQSFVRRAHREPSIERTLEQGLGQRDRPFTDAFDPDVDDCLIAGGCRVGRGN